MKQVLVTYASKHGATAQIAETVAEKLREFDLAVDCVPVGEVSDLSPYVAVVLGSAVYFNHWRGRAVRFLDRHADELSQIPFWIFSSGPVGEDGSSSDQFEPRRAIDASERLRARGHVVFGGRVDAPAHGPLKRALVERIPRSYRDRRDWGEIRTWAAAIAHELGGGRAVVRSHSAERSDARLDVRRGR